MSTVTDALDALSGEDGPWMKVFGITYTGTVFVAGSGKAVIDGPTMSEEDDPEDQRRERREILAEMSTAALVSNPAGMTLVHKGVTYLARERVRADDGMVVWRCVEARVMEAGRRPRS